MVLNSPFLVHHPGIKTKEMGTKNQNKTLEDKQTDFIHTTVLPELRLLHGDRKGCHL